MISDFAIVGRRKKQTFAEFMVSDCGFFAILTKRHPRLDPARRVAKHERQGASSLFLFGP
jgi:hypothetical protein